MAIMPQQKESGYFDFCPDGLYVFTPNPDGSQKAMSFTGIPI
jgi:hypothetical protein